jgi:lipopolysaccharide transport system ATP-binding protein
MLEIKNVSKRYFVKNLAQRTASFREILMDFILSPLRFFKKQQTFYALNQISFSLNKGDSLAVIGQNGSGKSTLLKILSKITSPTKGIIQYSGKVASLLEVGTGFHAELTGRENIFLNGAILGMSPREIQQKFEAIVSFAQVEDFLDEPVKRYSSGMRLRLAFGIAAHVEPDILIIDEVLAVGDYKFRQKCIDLIQSFGQLQKIFICVSHDSDILKKLCTKGLVLDQGKMVFFGPIEEALQQYLYKKPFPLNSIENHSKIEL